MKISLHEHFYCGDKGHKVVQSSIFHLGRAFQVSLSAFFFFLSKNNQTLFRLSEPRSELSFFLRRKKGARFGRIRRETGGGTPVGGAGLLAPANMRIVSHVLGAHMKRTCERDLHPRKGCARVELLSLQLLGGKAGNCEAFFFSQKCKRFWCFDLLNGTVARSGFS